VAWRGRTPSPLLIAAAISLALAVASLALPSGPTYDPYAWLIWGRELTHAGLSTTSGGTSWKPLPALLDALLAPLGRNAADGWLVVARAGAIFAIFMAYRLAARLAPHGSRVLAGAVAAVSLVLTREWLRRNGVGDAEGLMTAFGLLAVDRHLHGRRGEAFALLVAAGLIRVEMWPFAAAYGAWLGWRGGGRVRTPVALGALTVPVLWFGGDWLGSGHLTTAAGRALHPVPGSPGVAAHPALAVAREAFGMLPLPAWIAIAAAALAACTPTAFARAACTPTAFARAASARAASAPRAASAVLALAFAWTAVVAAMAERGYAGLPRFLFMASALEAVVAGIGAAWLVHAIGTRGAPSIRRPAIAAAACAAFALGCIPAAGRLPSDTAAIDKVADMDVHLADSVDEAAGVGAVLRCRTDAPWYTVTALAYDLDVQPSAIHARCPSGERRLARRGSAGGGSRAHARRATRA
jgi:hypothetical protein